MNTYYEKHSYQNEKLPIIYHYDVFSPGKGASPNWHENIELLLCVSGEAEAVISSRPAKMEKDSIIVVNSGRIHYTNTISERVEYHCLIIDADFLDEAGFSSDVCELEEVIRDERAVEIFLDITKELSDKKPYYESAVKGNILLLMAHLSRSYASNNVEGENDIMVKKAIRYIKKNYKNKINVEVLASYTGFSRFYFSRCFKRLTGYSVSEYTGFLRCREAKRLLTGTDMTVSEVAAMCGYGDVSYFTKVYKRHMGVCPSADSAKG